VANSSGQPIRINGYDAWGIPNGADGTGTPNLGRFQYTGQAWIAELGLYHYKARLYSPTLGRFLQTDPIGYDDQINLYAYVGNDPVNRRDPDGRVTWTVGLEAEVTIAFGVSGGFGIALSHPWRNDGAQWDVGVYGFVSGRSGYATGGGIAIGVQAGSVRDANSIAVEGTVSAGLFAGTVSQDITKGTADGVDGSGAVAPRARGFELDSGRVRAGAQLGASAGIKAQAAMGARSVATAIARATGLDSGRTAQSVKQRGTEVTVKTTQTGSLITKTHRCDAETGKCK
jgi:RHS repeat-associated protein